MVNRKKPMTKKQEKAASQIEEMKVQARKAPHALRGMKDIMPEDDRYWKHVFTTAQDMMETSYFERLEPPVLEEEKTFKKSLGEENPIMLEELYAFKDASGDSVALRPELRTGIVRAYIEHALFLQPQPVKLWHYGPCFRFDKPQSGRYRQFWQLGCEVMGDSHPVIDAQLISIVARLFDKLGIPITIQVNSIGDKQSRSDYSRALLDFLKAHKNAIPEHLKETYKKFPLRLFEERDEELQLVLQNAPQVVDSLTPEANAHFVKVLEHLDELDVPYVLNPRIMRGNGYFSHTVFEVFPAAEGETKPLSLGGGGRYDTLFEAMGGKQGGGAFGFSLGVDRMVKEMKRLDLKVPDRKPPEVFLAQLGDVARKRAIAILRQLHEHKFLVAESFSKEGLKAQMEIAAKLNVAYTLIIGQKEILDDTILIRDMENGIQEVIDSKKIVSELTKRLRNNGNGNGHA